MKSLLHWCLQRSRGRGPHRDVSAGSTPLFRSQHTRATWWEAALPHPRAKGVPAAAGSIFSCIIYLNTCLTVLDGAQSGKGGAAGAPTHSPPAGLRLPVCASLRPTSSQSRPDHTTDQAEALRGPENQCRVPLTGRPCSLPQVGHTPHGHRFLHFCSRETQAEGLLKTGSLFPTFLLLLMWRLSNAVCVHAPPLAPLLPIFQSVASTPLPRCQGPTTSLELHCSLPPELRLSVFQELMF